MIYPLAAITGIASLVLALNIGANNSAAEMGPAYGAGVRSRRQAVAMIAVCCTAGAVFAGQRVMTTVGHRLIAGDALAANYSGALVVVLSAIGLIGVANLLRIPVATSHVVVGAVTGLGLYYGTVNLPLVTTVVVWWIVTPLASLTAFYAAGRLLYARLVQAFGGFRSEAGAGRALVWAITISGCWMAFAAGSNGLAKAMGPAVGAGVLGPGNAAVLGGLSMALGALLLGGRVISTVGKEITSICPVCAIVVQIISASIVFTASRFGMPVSLAEIVTCSVIGFSCAANGVKGTAGNRHVRRIMLLWPAAPVTAGLLAFGLQAAFR